jgi:hypothetical protein
MSAESAKHPEYHSANTNNKSYTQAHDWIMCGCCTHVDVFPYHTMKKIYIVMEQQILPQQMWSMVSK